MAPREFVLTGLSPLGLISTSVGIRRIQCLAGLSKKADTTEHQKILFSARFLIPRYKTVLTKVIELFHCFLNVRNFRR